MSIPDDIEVTLRLESNRISYRPPRIYDDGSKPRPEIDRAIEAEAKDLQIVTITIVDYARAVLFRMVDGSEFRVPIREEDRYPIDLVKIIRRAMQDLRDYVGSERHIRLVEEAEKDQEP